VAFYQTNVKTETGFETHKLSPQTISLRDFHIKMNSTTKSCPVLSVHQ